jgi:hypothetical protein
MIGGNDCNMQVDGGHCEVVKTKGNQGGFFFKKKFLTQKFNNSILAAYPDFSFVLFDRNVFVEVDENQHQYYNQECELARLDLLAYGTDRDAIPTTVIRFNPHNLDFTLVAMIKSLIQTVKTELNRPLLVKQGINVIYMFYKSVSE